MKLSCHFGIHGNYFFLCILLSNNSNVLKPEHVATLIGMKILEASPRFAVRAESGNRI